MATTRPGARSAGTTSSSLRPCAAVIMATPPALPLSDLGTAEPTLACQPARRRRCSCAVPSA
eukprot:4988406-Pyramimonas_sp.AAC.1